jgi:hypothetical protein
LSGRDERGRPRRPAQDRAGSRRDPRTPPTLTFNPFAVGVAVFTGIAIPIVVVGYTRSSGVNVTIIVIGIALGLIAGVAVGAWVSARGGHIWKGPQL